MQISERHLTTIQKAIAETLVGIPCTVYLFGSRATGRARQASDVDLAVLAERDVSVPLSLLRERLEQSSIPYTVDVVDLSLTAATFAARVKQEGQVLWTNC